MPELEFSKLPNRGWELASVFDLGDQIGACQRCATASRYQHHCHHPIGVIDTLYRRARVSENALVNIGVPVVTLPA
jgi:hypothetical protein